MADLRLNVKREWFDKIKRGDKKDELRGQTPFWRKRLEGKTFNTVTICLGYPKKGDAEREMVFRWNGYVECTVTHAHFCKSQPIKVFAINLEERIR